MLDKHYPTYDNKEVIEEVKRAKCAVNVVRPSCLIPLGSNSVGLATTKTQTKAPNNHENKTDLEENGGKKGCDPQKT